MKLLLGDCLDKLKELEDNSIDSVVTDPPYGLSAAKNSGKSSKGGFMGKQWDYDVPSQEIWEECMRVLKPGGHILSFAGSRTYHRMAVRIEDAGFEIRDQIMWIYGSGFPKSHNIGKAFDKRGGNNHLVSEVAEKLKEARESRGISKTEADKLFCDGTTNYQWFEGRKDGVRLPDDNSFDKICNEWDELKPYQDLIKSANREVVGKYEGDVGGLGGERLGEKGGDITIASTDVAKQWEGWGTALKPAHEPIVMARKPLVGTVANNVLEWGVGGINIDGCRVGNEKVSTHSNGVGNTGDKGIYGTFGNQLGSEEREGRFPANIIFDEEAGKLLDEQSGTSKSSGGRSGDKEGVAIGGIYGDYKGIITDKNPGFGDSGGASRFFYCPKVSKSERNEGLDSLQTKQTTGGGGGIGDYKNDVNSASGKFGSEKAPSKNFHPTVKPTDLMAYLIRLVTKKGGVVLDPFMGSGSTGKAAIRGGFDFVGIEREKEYFEIADARIQYEIDNPYKEETKTRTEVNEEVKKTADKFFSF
jgi:DNA modification methylase